MAERKAPGDHAASVIPTEPRPHVGQQVRFVRRRSSDGEPVEANAWVHAVNPATKEETDEQMAARGESEPRFRRTAEAQTVDLFYDWPEAPFRQYAEHVPYSAESADSSWSFRGSHQ